MTYIRHLIFGSLLVIGFATGTVKIATAEQASRAITATPLPFCRLLPDMAIYKLIEDLGTAEKIKAIDKLETAWIVYDDAHNHGGENFRRGFAIVIYRAPEGMLYLQKENHAPRGVMPQLLASLHKTPELAGYIGERAHAFKSATGFGDLAANLTLDREASHRGVAKASLLRSDSGKLIADICNPENSSGDIKLSPTQIQAAMQVFDYLIRDDGSSYEGSGDLLKLMSANAKANKLSGSIDLGGLGEGMMARRIIEEPNALGLGPLQRVGDTEKKIYDEGDKMDLRTLGHGISVKTKAAGGVIDDSSFNAGHTTELGLLIEQCEKENRAPVLATNGTIDPDSGILEYCREHGIRVIERAYGIPE